MHITPLRQTSCCFYLIARQDVRSYLCVEMHYGPTNGQLYVTQRFTENCVSQVHMPIRLLLEDLSLRAFLLFSCNLLLSNYKNYLHHGGLTPNIAVKLPVSS